MSGVFIMLRPFRRMTCSTQVPWGFVLHDPQPLLHGLRFSSFLISELVSIRPVRNFFVWLLVRVTVEAPTTLLLMFYEGSKKNIVPLITP